MHKCGFIQTIKIVRTTSYVRYWCEIWIRKPVTVHVHEASSVIYKSLQVKKNPMNTETK